MKVTWSDSWFRKSILGPEWHKDDPTENREAPEEEEAVLCLGEIVVAWTRTMAQTMEREARWFRRYCYLGSRSSQYSKSNYNSEHRALATCQEPV